MASILHKRKAADPSASDLTVGELAINTSDGGLFTKTSGGSVVEVGSGGGVSSDDEYNTVAGTNAGANFSGTDATNNTLFGYDAGNDITTADNSIAIGYQALDSVTTGGGNTVVGANSGGALTTGYANTLMGNWAGSLVTGNANTFIGSEAGYVNTSGHYNTALGRYALKDNSTASSNVAIGYEAGENITTGGTNSCLGREAGDNLTTGSNNICIGFGSDASAADVSNEITLGDTNITKFRVPGLNFVVKDTTATEDYVLTVDANGEAGWEAAAGGGLSNIVEDTSPQLGGTLQTNGNPIQLAVDDRIQTPDYHLEIYHSDSGGESNSSIIRHADNSGELHIETSTEIHLQSSDTTPEIFGKFIKNGAAELYHDNSKTLETTATGTTITGLMTATTIDGAAGDNLSLDFGSVA